MNFIKNYEKAEDASVPEWRAPHGVEFRSPEWTGHDSTTSTEKDSQTKLELIPTADDAAVSTKDLSSKETIAEACATAKASYLESVENLVGWISERDQMLEKNIVDVSFSLFKQLLDASPAVKTEVAERWTKQAVALMQKGAKVKIRVHPDDYDAVLMVVEDYENSSGNIEVETDVELNLGGIVVESSAGQLDASISRKLDDAYVSMMGKPA